MKTVQKGGAWEVVDVPDCPEGCGPYRTKTEAEEIRVGLSRFFRHESKPGFITVDPVSPKEVKAAPPEPDPDPEPPDRKGKSLL